MSIYDRKPYLRNPRIRAALWLSLALLFGVLGLVGVIWEEEQKRQGADAAATERAEAGIASAPQGTDLAWEATKSHEDQQLMAIVSEQRELRERCEQVQAEGKHEPPASRPTSVVLWIAAEDGQETNELIWHKTPPPPLAAPASCLTDPLPSFARGQGGVVIVDVHRRLVGYYAPEGAPLPATSDIRYPAYEVTIHLCMTDLATRTITGADALTLPPPSKVGFALLGYPGLPGYPGDPEWRARAEEWACSIPVASG